MRHAPALALVLVAALTTLVVGLITGENELVFVGLTFAAASALVERLRGETTLSIGKDGLTASGTLIGAADVRREALDLLDGVGVEDGAAAAQVDRILPAAERILDAGKPITITGSDSARRGFARALAAELLRSECAICGVSAAEVPLEAAHIVPSSQGGENTKENLVALCPNCHRGFDSGRLALPNR